MEIFSVFFGFTYSLVATIFDNTRFFDGAKSILGDFILIFSILFPGMVCVSIEIRYGLYRHTKIRGFFIKMLMANFVIASLMSLFYFLMDWKNSYIKLINGSIWFKRTDVYDEVLWSIGIALGLSLLWLLAIEKRWLNRILKSFKVTRRSDGPDVWSFIHDDELDLNVKTGRAKIWDEQRKLLFKGKIFEFSDSGISREILLQNAEVYKYYYKGVEIIMSDKPIRTSRFLYISLSHKNFWIEYPDAKEKSNKIV